MSGSSRITELILRWADLRDRGQRLSAEELCRDCPELIDEMQRHIDAMEAGESALGRSPTIAPVAPTFSNLTSDSQVTGPPTLGFDDGGSVAAVPGFEILSELGRGGMGVVYKARQIPLNRLVALKMIIGGDHAESQLRIRFLHEAEVVAGLVHPNIVQVHEFGSHAGCPFFVLEFIAGGTLGQRIAAGPQPARESAWLVEMVARAMHFAHQQGIIHRDLKPSNILLMPSPPPSALGSTHGSTPEALAYWGVPKVSDFGLARHVDSDSGLTRTGAVLGTPSYMAPEQAAGKKELTPAVDIYSLGAILYELLIGRPPFRAATPLDTIWQVIHDDPVPPRRLNPKIPRDLETICLKCLAKDPGRRYAGADQLADDLRLFLHDEPIRARRPTWLERGWKLVRRHRSTATAITAALVVALLLVVGGIIRSRVVLHRHVAEHLELARERFAAAQNARDEDAERLLDDALLEFAAARALDPSAVEPQDGLADVYLTRGQRALDRGDFGAARALLGPLRMLPLSGDRAERVHQLDRLAVVNARLRIVTVPPGAELMLTRLGPDLLVQKSQRLGPAPLAEHEIAPGNFLLTANLAGHAELRYSLQAQRGQTVDMTLTLLRPDEIPAGMVFVPPGPFLVGDVQSGARVDLPGFFIDRTEVTGAEYERFVKATGAIPPDRWGGPTCPPSLRDQAVVNVSWYDAAEYAHWAEKRLPTDHEWEKAARGADGRPYPWGARFEAHRCVNRYSEADGLHVGRRLLGASPYGALDMAGNVWEWTQGREGRGRAERVIRGGAAYGTADELTTYLRKMAPPGGSSFGGLNLLGFRCVRSLHPEPKRASFLDVLTDRNDLAEAAAYYHVHDRWDRVRVCARRMLALNPRSVPGNYWEAIARLEARQPAEALAAVRIAYCQEHAYSSHGRSIRELATSVIDALEQAGQKPDRSFLDVPKWFTEAVRALNMGDPAKAAAPLGRILAVDPDHGAAHEFMAQVEQAAGRLEAATNHRRRRLDQYRAAIRENPSGADLHQQTAEFLLINNLEPAEALALARRGTELEPGVARYRVTYAEALAAAGQWDEAAAQMQHAIRIDPEEPSHQEALRAYQQRRLPAGG